MTDLQIADKLQMLEEYVDLLDGYRAHELEEVRSDPTLRGAVERYLHLALETLLDAGQVIIAHEGAKRPESYRDVPRILGEMGVLEVELATRLEDAAGLRNVLVHRYAHVDLARVHAFLQDDLDDLRMFRRAVARFARDR